MRKRKKDALASASGQTHNRARANANREMLYGDAFRVVESNGRRTIVPNNPGPNLDIDLKEVREIQCTLFDIFRAAEFPLSDTKLPTRLMNWSLTVFGATVASALTYLGWTHHGFPPIGGLVIVCMIAISIICVVLFGIAAIVLEWLQWMRSRVRERALFPPKASLAELHGIDYMAQRYRTHNIGFTLRRCSFERLWVLSCSAGALGALAFFANPIAAALVESVAHDGHLLKNVMPNVLAILPGAIMLATILSVAMNTPAFRLWRSKYLLELALIRQDERGVTERARSA